MDDFVVGDVIIDQYNQDWEVIAITPSKGRVVLTLDGPQAKAILKDTAIRRVQTSRWRKRKPA